jgi:hypothetical protein
MRSTLRMLVIATFAVPLLPVTGSARRNLNTARPRMPGSSS